MKAWVAIAVILLSPCLTEPIGAQAPKVVTGVPYYTPGAGGMNSTTDCPDMEKTEARLLQNLNASTYPGKLVARRSLRNIGDNSKQVYAAAGYFDDAHGWKQLLGIVGGDSTLPGPRRLADTAVLTVYHLGNTDSAYRRIAVSNRFETGVQDSIFASFGRLGRSTNYSLSRIPAGMCVADGLFPPLVYSPYKAHRVFQQRYIIQNDIASPMSDLNFGDSLYYGPSLRQLCPAAPGQPIVGLIRYGSGKTGTYRYRYSFGGQPGIESQAVLASGETPLVYGFDAYAQSDSIIRTTHTYIERSKDGGPYRAIDTILYRWNDIFVWLDTIPDATGSTPVHNSSPQRPGAFVMLGTFESDCPIIDSANAVDSNDVYYLAFSFYDELTGAESPLGPLTKTLNLSAKRVLDTVLDIDTIFVDYGLVGMAIDTTTHIFRKKVLRPFSTSRFGIHRPGYINVYRSEKNDSTVLYSMYHLRTNDMYPIKSQGSEDFFSPKLSVSCFPGYMTDAQLTSGLFPWDSMGFQGALVFIYHDRSILRGPLGEVLSRPPLVQGLDFPVSQIVWVNFRAWAIGDRSHPQRLYYSGYNAPYDWDALGFLSLDESDNDEAVTIVGSDDIHGLYLFKHNRVYAVVGYDPERDLNVVGLSNRHGAVNQRSVAVYGTRAYFLNQDLRVYALSGQQIEDISQPIADQLLASFGNLGAAETNAAVFPGDKAIFVVNRSTEDCFRYDLVSSSWSRNVYASGYVPVRSFDYDTASTSRGFGQDDRWYRLKSGSSFAHEVSSTLLVDSLSGQKIYQPAYQSPCYGDGVHTYEIQRVQVTASLSTGGYLKAVVYSEVGDSLGVDSVVASASALRNYSVPCPPNASKYPSVKITCGATNQSLTIHDVTVYYRRIGNEARL